MNQREPTEIDFSDWLDTQGFRNKREAIAAIEEQLEVTEIGATVVWRYLDASGKRIGMAQMSPRCAVKGLGPLLGH